MPLIYKICPRALWREAEAAGQFTGAPIDRQDGFIHFSTAAQVAETAARHFAGQETLRERLRRLGVQRARLRRHAERRLVRSGVPRSGLSRPSQSRSRTSPSSNATDQPEPTAR